VRKQERAHLINAKELKELLSEERRVSVVLADIGDELFNEIGTRPGERISSSVSAYRR
jgi:hypothetical protein